jgi:RNA polymerase sigma-B factor
MASSLGRWPTAEELAQQSELSEGEILEASALNQMDPRSLDESLDSEDMDEGATLLEFVGREDDRFELSLDRLTLATALDILPAREKTILKLRFYHQLSQRQIAERIHISQMHVSRLERTALQKLRKVLQRSSDALGFPARGSLRSEARLPAA